MSRKSGLIVAVAAAALAFEAFVPMPVAGVPKAYADVGNPLSPGSVAGVARRISRRTTRRTMYRNSIAGCSPYRAYYNCGGVYYAPTVENGVTVYVVVNP